MTPIRAQSRTEQESGPDGPAGGDASGVRRGRHRKPRPRKMLLAAGCLALAAGVLSLVRVAPEAGVGAPGTAEAEPRLDPGGSATDRSADTAATVAAVPTALPSATSAMGGRSPAPASSGSPAPAGSRTVEAPSGTTAVPTTIPTGAPSAPGGTTPRPRATAPLPRPAPATPTPTPTPTPVPSRSTADPGPREVCLPVIALCVDALGARDR